MKIIHQAVVAAERMADQLPHSRRLPGERTGSCRRRRRRDRRRLGARLIDRAALRCVGAAGGSHLARCCLRSQLFAPLRLRRVDRVAHGERLPLLGKPLRNLFRCRPPPHERGPLSRATGSSAKPSVASWLLGPVRPRPGAGEPGKASGPRAIEQRLHSAVNRSLRSRGRDDLGQSLVLVGRFRCFLLAGDGAPDPLEDRTGDQATLGR